MSDLCDQTLVVAPGRHPRTVLFEGTTLDVPDGWELLPPGDAGLTRRVKAGGPTWTEKERRRRRMVSLGVWAPADRIAAARGDIEAHRATPEYQRKLTADRDRRARAHEEYVVEFELLVATFLSFHRRHRELERQMARAIAAHATPVGSGTVARTQRIPVEQRAEAAVIAWLRHQTTAYDRMSIARVKGRRREVRRGLARESRRLLDRYRRDAPPPANCPLQRALGLEPEDAPISAPETVATPETVTAPERAASPEAASPPDQAAPAATKDREVEQRALYEKVRARFQR